ncbi:MAG: cytidyltransferase, partial [Prevotellaceae bacterium]|nr:cytidyltransferase [Prevotellaceae bacterium]
GSQDSLGIVYPGLNKFYYNNGYWPDKITSVCEEEILNWLEEHIYMIPLYPRHNSYNVLENTHINEAGVKALSMAADITWSAILKRDIEMLGKGITDSFEAQIAMFPSMVDDDILAALNEYKKDAIGWKLSGAGGGGYFIFIAKNPESREGMNIKMRRE